MKKTIKIIAIVIIALIFLLLNFGIQIGDVRIGKQLDLQTKQNYEIENSSFYKNHFSKNKLTVVNLWATWCEPCIEEMPTLNLIQEKYQNQNFEFISISVDTDSLKVIKFVESGKFKFNDITLQDLKYRNAILNCLENRKLDQWISSKSVPITYLIKNKKVLKKLDGSISGEELEKAINKYK